MIIVYGVFLIAFVLLGIFALAFSRMLRRLWAPAEPGETVAQWVDEFSVARYRPMRRLLAESDYCFLRSQPGFRPDVEKKLRSQRKRIFRDYMRLMSTDFHRLLGVANLLMIHSVEDKHDLAKQLGKQRRAFYWAFCVIECRLILGPANLAGVDVEGLVTALDCLRQDVAGLMPEAALIDG